MVAYDPDQLRTFLAVAQSLSFTQAADRLGIRQPTVSQHVRKLEMAVGRPLFVRDTRTVTLTADQSALAAKASDAARADLPESEGLALRGHHALNALEHLDGNNAPQLVVEAMLSRMRSC